MKNKLLIVLSVGLLVAVLLPSHVRAAESGGSVGVEGRIGAEPPKTAATIAVPRSGAGFSSLPITVSGICPTGLLVRVFKNNVFGGAVQCTNGSYSVQIDLFSGQNDLVARVYDALDQAGPDSNTVTITYNDPRGPAVNRPTLTSNYAKRGANPNEKLTWPIILSGGEGPYAISVDWGDGTSEDLFTQSFPGTFDISHTYKSSGVYNVIVRASDKNQSVAFLQLVGIANGQIAGGKEGDVTSNTVFKDRVIWWPLLVFIPLLMLSFWLGRRHVVRELRQRLS